MLCAPFLCRALLLTPCCGRPWLPIVIFFLGRRRSLGWFRRFFRGDADVFGREHHRPGICANSEVLCLPRILQTAKVAVVGKTEADPFSGVPVVTVESLHRPRVETHMQIITAAADLLRV